MACPRTVAVRRTDRQALREGAWRRALRARDARPVGAFPAAPRASARVRGGLRVLDACGRWRCRWTVDLGLVDAARRAAGMAGERAAAARAGPPGGVRAAWARAALAG